MFTKCYDIDRNQAGEVEVKLIVLFVCVQPRKALLEQLSRLLPPDDGILPEHVVLVAAGEGAGSALAARLTERQQRVFSIMGPADVKATMTCLISKIQKL